jgi:hypothetical protein
MQGFYFSKPLPAEELAAYLRQEPMSEESAPREAKRGLKLVGNAERRIGK